MATYNGAPYLREQLESFVTQTRHPDELIVCDDNSTDDTIIILGEFKKVAPFDVHIHVNKENLGYAQNFSKALSYCLGDLVFLSDQDDVWFKDKIATLTEMAEKDSRNEVFMNDAELTHEDLTPTGITILSQHRSVGMSNGTFEMGCCAAIRGRFLKQILPVPVGNYSHDGWIVNMADGLRRRRITEKTLQYYRRHGKNASMSMTNKIQPLNRFRLYKIKILSSLRKGDAKLLKNRLQATNMLLDKVEQMRQSPVLCDGLDIDLENFASLLSGQLETLELRVQLTERSRFARVPMAIKMLVDGRYSQNSGLKSALRDIVRR